jgi:hypothetical protein
MGIALRKALKTQQIEQPNGTTVVLAWTKTKASVLPCREVREQGIVLEHHANAATLRWKPVLASGHDAVLKMDRSLLRPLKTSDQAQQSCLSTTGGSEQTHKLSCFEFEVDATKGPVV